MISTAAATLAGAGISGGSSILGGWMSQQANKKLAKKQFKYQKKILQNQLSWRVNDAKRAGIHPLYALGLSPASYSSPIGSGNDLGSGISEAGQAIGGAMSRLPSRTERQESVLRNKLLEAQIGETDARTLAIQSETARNLQNARAQVSGAATQLGVMDENARGIIQPTIPMDPQFIYQFDLSQSQPGRNSGAFSDLPGAGLVEKEAPRIKSHTRGDRGLEAGESAGFKKWRLPSGLPIELPAGETMTESLEETPFWMWPSIIQHNKRKYGPQWGKDFMEYLLTGGAPWHQNYAD